VGKRHQITIYPAAAEHRLVGVQLSTFLDRLSQHLVALGYGAVARLRAGGVKAECRSWASLVVEINAARKACQGTADLRIDIQGPACDRFARFLGARSVHIRFEAFVEPREFQNAKVCWWLQLLGEGPQGVGERVVDEERRLAESVPFGALEGAARTRLLEHQEWR
jgi:hypothetical protein